MHEHLTPILPSCPDLGMPTFLISVIPVSVWYHVVVSCVSPMTENAEQLLMFIFLLETVFCKLPSQVIVHFFLFVCVCEHDECVGMFAIVHM